jgi:hypothetical protein
MIQVILNNDQARLVRATKGEVELRDEHGTLIGYVTQRAKATPEEIAEARRRLLSDGPWRTTAEVLSRLRAAELE